MKKGIRGIALGVALCTVLTSTYGGASVWAESSDGDTDIRPQDDFYGYVNAEELREAELDPKYGYGAFESCYMNVDGKLYSIIDEASAGAISSSTDAEYISDFYQQVVSYDPKSSDADKDFEDVQKKISEVKTVADYMELCGELEYDYNVCPLFDFDIGDGIFDSKEYSFGFNGRDSILGISKEDIANTESGRENIRNKTRDVLVSLGTEKKTAERKADDFASMAVEIAFDSLDCRFDFSNLKELTTDELEKNYSFDIDSFEKGLTVDNPYDKWVITYPEQFECVAENLSDEENLETFKTWLLLEYVDGYHDYLSDEYKGVKDIYGENTEEKDIIAKEMIKKYLPDQLGRLYKENCYPADRDEKVLEMCENIRDSYRELIGDADWLTQDARTKLLSKLEKIEFKTGGSFDTELVSTDGVIGKDSYDTVKNINRYKYDNFEEKVKKERSKQGQTMQPQTVNACYWTDNVVVMTAAITEEPFFNEDDNEYANLGKLGMIIAHEVGHAFDSNCMNWDDEGKYNPEWLSEEDRKALRERADMCIDYYNEYTIMEVYHDNGEATLGENYADIGAIECISNIAEKKEDLKIMYEGFASIWCELQSDVMAVEQLSRDEHSPGPIRVNAPLSSCDKFYEVYDVKEGDDMYVAPESRVKRW